MQAIVYTSHTGSTAQYAYLLGRELGITVYNSMRKLEKDTEIIYLGWIMAGKVQGYSSIKNKYKVCAVCAVGMGQTGTQTKEVRTKNKIKEDIPLFTLQGNFDVKRLHGIYRITMNIMVKTIGKALEKKENKTKEEEDMLDMMIHGGERVNQKNLQDVIDWYRKGGCV